MENGESVLEKTRIVHQEKMDITLSKFKIAEKNQKASYEKIAAKISAVNPDDLVNIEAIVSVNIASSHPSVGPSVCRSVGLSVRNGP